MKGFFFDENLPTRIQFKPNLPLVVWEFAHRRELVIVSQEADLSERIILSTPPPCGGPPEVR